MILATGLDLVEVARIEQDIERFGDRFVNRILGPREREVFGRRTDRAIFLGGRFAAKEAVIKALGYRLTERPSYTEIEIINNISGRPELELPDAIRSQLGPVRCHLSITHERTHAAAVAIIEELS